LLLDGMFPRGHSGKDADFARGFRGMTRSHSWVGSIPLSERVYTLGEE
jgi:hypothetical protein